MPEPMTLGALIDALAVLDADREVRFDFCGLRPRGLDSYRGDYSNLAIGWDTAQDLRPAPVVANLLAALRAADGEVFTGWKGGDYIATRETPVWASNRGELSQTAIVGVTDSGWVVVLDTAWCDR